MNFFDVDVMPDAELERLVLAHRFLYYVMARPVISDREYDMLERAAQARLPETTPLNQPGSDREESYGNDVIERATRLLVERV